MMNTLHRLGWDHRLGGLRGGTAHPIPPPPGLIALQEGKGTAHADPLRDYRCPEPTDSSSYNDSRVSARPETTAFRIGTRDPAGLFAAQGQLESRERAAIGLQRRGARAQFEELERHSKAAAGRVTADPFVAAAGGAKHHRRGRGLGSAAAGAGAVPGPEAGGRRRSLPGVAPRRGL